MRVHAVPRRSAQGTRITKPQNGVIGDAKLAQAARRFVYGALAGAFRAARLALGGCSTTDGAGFW